MKFLTLVQPWASLIAEGHKSIETRGYSTQYRGPLAIHAGKAKLPKCDGCYGHGIVPSGPDYGVDCCPECGGCGHITVGADVINFDTMQRGVVLAVADLVDVLPMVATPLPEPKVHGQQVIAEGHVLAARLDDSRCDLEWRLVRPVDDLEYGDFTPGRYGWVLENVRPINPVPMKGALGIQDVPGPALTQILAQILP